jgi:hypothetical protein
MLLMMIRIERVRNFRIIPHINHGMSALADRLSQWTGMSGREIPRHFGAAAARAGAQSLLVFLIKIVGCTSIKYRWIS